MNFLLYKNPSGQDRTAAERNYVTEATRCRWETLLCNRGNKKNMKSVFEVQGNCLTVHLPEEVDHPVSEDIRKESDNIMRKKRSWNHFLRPDRIRTDQGWDLHLWKHSWMR